MIWRGSVLSFAALVLATVVAAQGATYDYDKHASFLNYKKYKWVPLPSTEQLDELTASQLVGTLQVELEKKGLTKTDGDDADLFIGYQIANPKAKPLHSENVGTSYGSVGGVMAGGSANVTTVHSGQLVLDIYDAAKKQLVWRGVVADPIDADAKPDKKQKHLSKAVERLLKNYPPPKKS